MQNTEKTFFELIKVTLGNQDCLSHVPSVKEWNLFYEMAKKQSLVGVCFYALQRLGADVDEGFEQIGLSEKLYLVWMGMAAKIQQKNEKVNKQCIALQKRFLKDGLRTCVLKGQGVAQLYDDSLLNLRQSGDIDLWVDAKREDIVKYVQQIAPTDKVREHHIELSVFENTAVEVHFWPAVIRHFVKNKKLQKWFDSRRDENFSNEVATLTCSEKSIIIYAPTPEFHTVQQMAHMYHHLFDSGIGLRQVMDYYFVLKALSSTPEKRKALATEIEHIGMAKFASAMMYVLHVAMGLDEEMMILPPNKEDGEFLLGEIMRGGNFGNHDDRKVRDTSNYFSSFYGSIFRNMRYLRFNPFDWFWSPLWRLYYFGWRKLKGYK